jgi:cyanophycin synthetase
MRITDYTIYRGRNIFSHQPVIKLVVDIGEYREIPTNEIPNFNEKLLEAFPGLKKNHCSLGYEGGFLEKLNKGTYLAHVVEHVILEMQAIIGYNVLYGKTRFFEEPSKYYIAYEYTNEISGLECGKAAVYILNCFITDERVDVDEILSYLKSVARDADLGPSTAAILAEAKSHGIPAMRFGHESMIHLGYGKYRRTLQATLTDATSCISADIAANKQLTKIILSENMIPVPYGKVVFTEISALLAAKQIGTPVAVKPHDGNQGKGVHLNLTKETDIRSAFKDASSYSSAVIVEQYIKGRDYRVLVVGDKVRAVSERLAAAVVGDGVHTIRELIDIVNQDENRGENHEKPLTKIKTDAVSLGLLKRMGFSMRSVPEAGEVVKLRENGNLSTGGVAMDRTDEIHPENAELAVRAASALGIDIAGIDFVTEDIGKSIKETGGVIVEVNTAPGIRMHLFPSEGTPRNVAKDIVDFLYPSDGVLNFPIVSVTGTNGKTTTARLIAYVLRRTGKTVGLTTTSGTYVNGKCIVKGDNTGPVSASVLLANKSIDAAVLETARGGIIRAGLGYDLADVGVITNIAEDHIGLGDVQDLEDLAFVKALVVEAVKKNGTAVLNADDAMTEKILERVQVNVLFFTNDIAKAKQRFPDSRYGFVYVDGDRITIESGGRKTGIAYIQEIPITENGTIRCNVDNCLAAAASLYALHVSPLRIASGFKSFTENPGRFNRYDLGGFSVMLDYAHNPAGYNAFISAVNPNSFGRHIGVIGVPGDRLDEAAVQVGGICAGFFDRLYVKEDEDLRGREPGEVAGLLVKGALNHGFPEGSISVTPNELDALKSAVSEAQTGDLIAVFYEKFEPLANYLAEYAGKLPQ